MTPVRRRLAIAAAVLLALGLLAASGLAYLWSQATALPEWYTATDPDDRNDYAGEPSSEPDAVQAPGTPQPWIALDEHGNRLPDPDPILDGDPSPAPLPRRSEDHEARPSPAPARPRPPRAGREPSRHELRGFHRRGKQPSPAVRASRAVYEDGRLEIGVILDLQRLPKNELKPRDRARYERAVDRFPGITARDVWVGVEDEPISVGGYLALSPEAEVRVGTLTYSLSSAAERMGMTPLELRLELNRELRRLGFVDPEA